MTTFVDRYTMLERISNGINSTVYSVVTNSRPAKLYCAKVIDKVHLLKHAHEEARLYRNVNLHLPRFIDVLADSKSVTIVTEMADGDLMHLLETTDNSSSFLLVYGIDTTKKLFRKILDSVQTMHSYGLLHGDIKPENILVFRPDSTSIHREYINSKRMLIKRRGFKKYSNTAKWGILRTSVTSNTISKEEIDSLVVRLCDVGQTQTIGVSGKYGGTDGYIAPEVSLTTRKTIITPALDIWALGVVLHLLTTNEFPRFVTSNLVATERFDKVGKDIQDMITGMLEFDPVKRPSLNSIQNWTVLK